MGLAGMIHQARSKLPESQQEALQYFIKGTKKEDPLSMYGLGMLHLQGKGVEKDLKLGLSLIEKASDKQVSDAQVQLGILMIAGTITPRNLEKAKILFTLAARQGNLRGHFSLGVLHYNDIPQTQASCTLAFSVQKFVLSFSFFFFLFFSFLLLLCPAPRPSNILWVVDAQACSREG